MSYDARLKKKAHSRVRELEAENARLLGNCAEKDAALEELLDVCDAICESRQVVDPHAMDHARAALDSDGSGYAAIIEAARKARRIRKDYEYFDGDRRGIGENLTEAEDELDRAFDALDKG